MVEVLLVIDATTGQNGLSQAKQFTEAVGVTGVVLTKLDGSAKGGIVFAVEHELGLPVNWLYKEKKQAISWILILSFSWTHFSVTTSFMLSTPKQCR